jgi:DNA-binding YbaB/EbfC family protein
MADWNDMLSKAQEMQGRLQQVQQELARRTVTASAGGGMVTAVATGELRILEIRIEPEIAGGDDREMLQDLVTAAVNAALAKAQQMVQQEMQKASGLPLFQGSGPGGEPG